MARSDRDSRATGVSEVGTDPKVDGQPWGVVERRWWQIASCKRSSAVKVVKLIIFKNMSMLLDPAKEELI